MLAERDGKTTPLEFGNGTPDAPAEPDRVLQTLLQQGEVIFIFLNWMEQEILFGPKVLAEMDGMMAQELLWMLWGTLF